MQSSAVVVFCLDFINDPAALRRSVYEYLLKLTGAFLRSNTVTVEVVIPHKAFVNHNDCIMFNIL